MTDAITRQQSKMEKSTQTTIYRFDGNT